MRIVFTRDKASLLRNTDHESLFKLSKFRILRIGSRKSVIGILIACHFLEVLFEKFCTKQDWIFPS